MNGEERKLMAKVAKLYYVEGWTQTEIAKKINKSRPVVSKYLKLAKEKKLAEIYIKDATLHTVQLERLLEQSYGLKEVIVVSSVTDGKELTLRKVGKAAADYVASKLDSINSLGITWGKSVLAFAEGLDYQMKPNVSIVPLTGGMGQSHVHYHSNHIAFQLAQKLNTTSYYLYAPAMVENEDLREHIIHSKDISEVMRKGEKVDLAVVGIGNPSVGSTLEEMGYISAEEQETLAKAGAIGDINSNFYDANGKLANHSLNNRTIGIDMEGIKTISEVLVVVSGEHKVQALHTALENKLINTVVIDDTTASHLLEIKEN